MLDYLTLTELIHQFGRDWVGDFICETAVPIELRDLIFEMYDILEGAR